MYSFGVCPWIYGRHVLGGVGNFDIFKRVKILKRVKICTRLKIFQTLEHYLDFFI